MDNTELLRAISVRDINQVRQVLTSGQCSVKGGGLTSAELHPIVQCIKFGYWACDARGCEILELLVQHGANTNIKYLGKTVLIFAAELDHWDCLQVLCNSGADLSCTTQDGDTAIMIAAKKGNAECVKCLLEHSSIATINQRNECGETALIAATISKSIQCMEHLISAGADLNVTDANGYTALMHGIQAQSKRVIDLLMDRGAQLNIVAEYGITPLHILVKDNVIKFNTAPLVLKGLNLGIDPTLSRHDHPMLHTRVGYEEDAILRALVMSGFPPLDLDCTGLLGCCWNINSTMSPQDILGTQPVPISPLAVALILVRPGVAWYFIANNFFTHFDIEKLCWHKKIREFLQKELEDESEDSHDMYCQVKQCLTILNYLASKPHSLHTLCLVALSSALSQDFAHKPTTDLLKKETWICKPTFKKRVDCLKIPPSLKRELLHQTPLSGICCLFWHHIPNCDDMRFETCHCNDCECKEIDD